MVKLIKSGFRKDRAILSVFLLIIVISVFILHSGIFASMYPRLYDEYARDQGLADGYVYTDADHEFVDSVLAGNMDIVSYTVQDMLEIKNLKSTTSRNSKEKTGIWSIQRFGDNAGCKKLDFEEYDNSVSGRRIYINSFTAAVKELHTGDKIYINTVHGKLEYTVAGVFQYLLMDDLYLVDGDSFDELAELSGSREMCIAYLYAKDGTDTGDVMQNVKTALQSGGKFYTDGYSSEEYRSGYTVIVNVLAGFMAVFALIIMMICMIMIVFTINNNISRDIVNIGVLRAAGYTVRQIRAALTAEYVIVGTVGAVAGIALSYVLFPVMDRGFIREICGIIWKKRLYPAISFTVLAAVVLFMIGTAYFSTKKIKNLHPATALRFGLKSNSFRKNHLPLSETKGELNLLLALKSSMQNMGQNVTIFFIITAVAFVTMISCLLYYNTKVDITNFQRMIQGDSPDIYIYPEDNSYDSAYSSIEKIRSISGVSQAYGLDSVTASTGGVEVTLIYVTDPDYVYCGIYEGEIMRKNNEVVVGSSVAAKLGVGVGDEIAVEYGDKSRRYLVTGLQQNVLSSRLYMTDKAAQEIGIDTVYNSLRVRVRNADAGKVDDVINRIESKVPGIIRIRNNYRELRSNDYTPVLAVAIGVFVMIILSIATVLLVIRLLLKTVFIRKEREFGIKKAVGFTSNQLRYQLALSLMPTTMAASVSGAVLGFFLLDPLFTLILGGYGIRDANLLLQPLLILITAAAVTGMVFVFCFLMSGRMKKLSAYKLIQE